MQPVQSVHDLKSHITPGGGVNDVVNGNGGVDEYEDAFGVRSIIELDDAMLDESS